MSKNSKNKKGNDEIMKLIKQILGFLGIVAFGLIGFVLVAVVGVVGGVIFAMIAMTQFNTQAWIEFAIIIAIIVTTILIIKRRKIKSFVKRIAKRNKKTEEFDYDKWAIENNPEVRDLYLAQIKFSPTSKRKDHDDLKLDY